MFINYVNLPTKTDNYLGRVEFTNVIQQEILEYVINKVRRTCWCIRVFVKEKSAQLLLKIFEEDGEDIYIRIILTSCFIFVHIGNWFEIELRIELLVQIFTWIIIVLRLIQKIFVDDCIELLWIILIEIASVIKEQFFEKSVVESHVFIRDAFIKDRKTYIH